VARSLASDNDRRFLARVFATPMATYEARLAAIGFTGCDHVLDAGCGFGQWSQALRAVNRRVTACDVMPSRIGAARALATGVRPIEFHVAALEALPYPSGTFDAVFCYGALFVCDLRLALDECTRVLRPGGRLYATANDVGWLAHRLAGRTPGADDFAPDAAALAAVVNTVRYFAGHGRTAGQQLIVPVEVLRAELAMRDYETVRHGAEGTLAVDGAAAGPSFFPATVAGHTACYEVLAVRATPDSAAQARA
jgi:SAM-dependent methyltransferase